MNSNRQQHWAYCKPIRASDFVFDSVQSGRVQGGYNQPLAGVRLIPIDWRPILTGSELQPAVSVCCQGGSGKSWSKAKQLRGREKRQVACTATTNKCTSHTAKMVALTSFSDSQEKYYQPQHSSYTYMHPIYSPSLLSNCTWSLLHDTLKFLNPVEVLEFRAFVWLQTFLKFTCLVSP